MSISTPTGMETWTDPTSKWRRTFRSVATNSPRYTGEPWVNPGAVQKMENLINANGHGMAVAHDD